MLPTVNILYGYLQSVVQAPVSVNKHHVLDIQEGSILGRIANVPVKFLIDSGAEVNTVNEDIFSTIISNERSKENAVLCLKRYRQTTPRVCQSWRDHGRRYFRC